MTKPNAKEVTDSLDRDLAAPKKPTPMDPALRLASKLDRIMGQMPAWVRMWAIRYLEAKYVSQTHEFPQLPPPGDPAYRKGANAAEALADRSPATLESRR